MKTEKETLSDGEKNIVLKLFKSALKEVIDFRNQEGEIIFKDFNNRLLVLNLSLIHI